MKKNALSLLIFGGLIVGAIGQAVNEPPELTELRAGWQRTRLQVTAPIDKRYRDHLDTLKLRFTREGKLNEALAIDAEIKKLDGVTAAPQEPATNKLQIISAFYGEVAGNRRVETTAVLRKALEDRQEVIKLNTRFGADGKDPAPAAPKETTITYFFRGETKTKKFPENYDLKFKEDLR